LKTITGYKFLGGGGRFRDRRMGEKGRKVKKYAAWKEETRIYIAKGKKDR
jgi:hypothetical protein